MIQHPPLLMIYHPRWVGILSVHQPHEVRELRSEMAALVRKCVGLSRLPYENHGSKIDMGKLTFESIHVLIARACYRMVFNFNE